jgi:hypothetical protein
MKTMATIQEVIDSYKAEGAEFIDKDYRDIVDIIRKARYDMEIPNNDYSHALWLSNLMFQSTSKNIRMLNGISSGCDCFEVLKDSLAIALQRIKRCDGYLKAIFVGEGDVPSSIVQLREEFGDTVQFVTATAGKPIKHFIACDDNKVRLEELHDPITPDMDSDQIKASVYLNSPARTRETIKEFNTIWDYLNTSD